MSRYIDADELEIDLKGVGNLWKEPFDSVFGYTNGQIKSAPSIDIVRCKECRHNPWDLNRTDYTCIWDDDFADRPQTPDNFCSYGERREP